VAPRDTASSVDPWRQSLRRSRLRRAAARRKLRWRLRRRGLTFAVAGLMTLTAGGALAASQGSSSALVKRGARGATVTAVQRALGIPADGVFGPATKRAVRHFQRSHGLEVDGVVGPATRAALGIAPAAGPAPAAAPAPGAAPAPSTTTTDPATTSTLKRIASCESGGNPRAVSASGRYRGKYQFARATWHRLGGKGDPAAAPEAEQDLRAARLLARAGTAPWAACA
jgi:hypothetical protein